MVARVVISVAVFSCLVGCAGYADAQQVNRVQPIILEASPACCASPAATATASELVCLPCGDSTYLPPKARDPLRVVPATSQLKPLSPAQPMRGYEMPCNLSAGRPTTIEPIPSATSTTTPLTVPTTVSPAVLPAGPVTTTVLRPDVCAANCATGNCATCAVPVQTVPDGYVLGKGSLGQPTLYKPGQPVRNFFRFFTL